MLVMKMEEGKQVVGRGERTINWSFSLLVHHLDECRSCSWIKLKPPASNSIRFFHLGGRGTSTVPSSAFAGTSRELELKPTGWDLNLTLIWDTSYVGQGYR